MRKLIDNTVGFFKHHRKLAWFCLLAVVAASGLTLWSREDDAPRPAQISKPIAFSVSFQGYSNSPSGQRWAILTVTNQDFGNLSLADPMTVELSGHPRDEQGAHWYASGFIPPHSSGRMVVEVPLAPGTWRARCIILRWTWRDTVHNAFPPWVPDCLIPVQPIKTMDSLVTEWITNQSKKPLSTDVQRLEERLSGPN